MARERTACSVRFNCIPISRAFTSVSANERSRSSSSGVHGLIFFSRRRHRSPISSTSAPALQAGGCHHFDISLKKAKSTIGNIYVDIID